jgi:ethanolamine ammonia-lyase large subunit
MKLIDESDLMHHPTGMATASLVLSSAGGRNEEDLKQCVREKGVRLEAPRHETEDVFGYIGRQRGLGTLDAQTTLYRQIVGAANDFKEGDLTIGVAAADEDSRTYARSLLARTAIGALQARPLFRDGIYDLVAETTAPLPPHVENMTLGALKSFVLTQSQDEIKAIMPCLRSDIIACLVKIMTNEELIVVGQTVFNPLPGSKIGSKGYMSARIQPNSPTDHTVDIVWQVLDGFSYAVGDLVLGNNPVSSEPASVAAIEAALYDVLVTFDLQDTLPNCVLSHIDVQRKAEDIHPGTTGIWFQSMAGTVEANRTFDVTIDKMKGHLAQRTNSRYGLYGETGQGADFTNGHGAGFDMVVHEARKYGFLRALQQGMPRDQWMHVNDVAGFIGPEVFRTKEQLVRCCLEDTAMGKLHGLTIGLDICSTLHMDVTLDDLDWCIDHVMPANPGYLMALPTKNDPMLSYLTTSFSDHVRVREKFQYKVNDDMWAFFQRLGVIDEQGKPTEHFGQPLWVYYQFRKAKGDTRSQEDIYAEGRQCIDEIQGRGVPIAQGYGENIWNPPPALEQEVRRLYEDAKVSLWTELTNSDVETVPMAMPLYTQAKDRRDYVYHPESGEKLSVHSIESLQGFRQNWGSTVPDVQLVISDGLNVRALMDEGHLLPFLTDLCQQLEAEGLRLSPRNLVITYGRVRAGYMVGEVLFGDKDKADDLPRGIIHIIGERPGSGHHNFSAYLTAQPAKAWGTTGMVDHNVTRVVSGISDTALHPRQAAAETAKIFQSLRLQCTQSG